MKHSTCEKKQQSSLEKAIVELITEKINWGGIALYLSILKLPELEQKLQTIQNIDESEKFFKEIVNCLIKAYRLNNRETYESDFAEFKIEFNRTLIENLFKRLQGAQDRIGDLESITDQIGVQVDDMLPNLREIISNKNNKTA